MPKRRSRFTSHGFKHETIQNAARRDTRHAGARRRRRRHRPLVRYHTYRPHRVASPASCCTRATPVSRTATALELRRRCDAAAGLTKGAAAEGAAKAAATLAGHRGSRVAAVLLRIVCQPSRVAPCAVPPADLRALWCGERSSRELGKRSPVSLCLSHCIVYTGPTTRPERYREKSGPDPRQT
eukprot:scaffold126615_cov63-Phaeocystis_antarctica.AAC.1